MVVKNSYELEFRPSSEAEGGASVPYTRILGQGELSSDFRWLDLCIVKPEAEISFHGHRIDDEIYFILQGHGVQRVNDQEATVGPGDAILLRCGGSHGLRNESDEELHVLVIDLLAPQEANQRLLVRNIYDAPLTAKRSSGGAGEILVGEMFTAGELGPAWDFLQCVKLPAGSAVGLHTHHRDEEIYYVAAGHGALTDNGEEFAVGPGSAALCSPGGSHALANSSDEDLVLLVAQAPVG